MQRILTDSLSFLLCFVGLATASELTDRLSYLMNSPPRISSWDVKALWPLGDQAAIALMRMYDEDHLLQPTHLDSALWILSAAFEEPSWIENPEDRQPRATIFLLKVLERDVEEAKYKEKISLIVNQLSNPKTVRAKASPVARDDPTGAIDSLVDRASSRSVAPDFTLTSRSGADFRLSDHRGHVVLLNFWSPRQGYSGVEIPWFNEFQTRYKEQGLDQIGILEETRGSGFLNAYTDEKRLAINYTVASDDGEVASRFSVGSLPTTVLIDRHGRTVVLHSVGRSGVGPYKCTYEGEIQRLLSEGTGDAGK